MEGLRIAGVGLVTFMAFITYNVQCSAEPTLEVCKARVEKDPYVVIGRFIIWLVLADRLVVFCFWLLGRLEEGELWARDRLDEGYRWVRDRVGSWSHKLIKMWAREDLRVPSREEVLRIRRDQETNWQTHITPAERQRCMTIIRKLRDRVVDNPEAPEYQVSIGATKLGVAAMACIRDALPPSMQTVTQFLDKDYAGEYWTLTVK